MTATPDQPNQPGQPTAPSDPNAPTDPNAPKPPSKRDVLKASPAEQAELERYIAKGHGAHSTVLIMSILGILVVFAGVLYWKHFDYVRINNDWVPFGARVLPEKVNKQNDQLWTTYSHKRGINTKPDAPEWPLTVYYKLRFDSYLIGGLAVILALILIHMEKAKLQRNDLLVFRAMAREIEKLRIRVRQLEGKKGADPAKES